MGSGLVTSSAGGINCGSNCMVTLPYGTMVTLTVMPAAGSLFTGWTNAAACSTGTTCAVALTSSLTIYANFDPQPLLWYTLDDLSGANIGSVPGYTLTLQQSVSTVVGEIGHAMEFDTDGAATVSGIRAVLGVYPQYTIAFWIYESATPQAPAVVLGFQNNATAPYGGLTFSTPQRGAFQLCLSSTSNANTACTRLAGVPSQSWHHIILRYAGTGTGAGQGAGVDVYEDDVLVTTVANDANNDPVFNMNISDTLKIAPGGTTVDDLRIYNQTFTPAEQCATIIGGIFGAGGCTLP